MKRKAQLNEVIWFNPHYEGRRYGVVVEYRSSGWDRYRVIRTDPIGRNPHGPAIWIDATRIISAERSSKRPGIVLRHNERLEEIEPRGCFCNCCHHVAGFEAEPSDEEQE